MFKRIVDINGDIINLPEHYHSCLQEAQYMLDKMDEDLVDRSDMHVIVDALMTEIRFHLTVRKRRDA